MRPYLARTDHVRVARSRLLCMHFRACIFQGAYVNVVLIYDMFVYDCTEEFVRESNNS